MMIPNSGAQLNIEYASVLMLKMPRSGYNITLIGARSGSLPAMKFATDGLNE